MRLFFNGEGGWLDLPDTDGPSAEILKTLFKEGVAGITDVRLYSMYIAVQYEGEAETDKATQIAELAKYILCWRFGWDQNTLRGGWVADQSELNRIRKEEAVPGYGWILGM